MRRLVYTLLFLGAYIASCGTPGPLPPLPGPIGPDVPPAAAHIDGGAQG